MGLYLELSLSSTMAILSRSDYHLGVLYYVGYDTKRKWGLLVNENQCLKCAGASIVFRWPCVYFSCGGK